MRFRNMGEFLHDEDGVLWEAWPFRRLKAAIKRANEVRQTGRGMRHFRRAPDRYGS